MRLDPLLLNYAMRIRKVILSILVFLVFLFFMVPRFFEEVQASDSSDGEEALPILRSSRARKIIPNRKFIQ